MIEFKCDGCGKDLQVSDGLAGKRGRCPRCKIAVNVPEAGERDDGIDFGRLRDLVPDDPAPAPPRRAIPQPRSRPTIRGGTSRTDGNATQRHMVKRPAEAQFEWTSAKILLVLLIGIPLGLLAVFIKHEVIGGASADRAALIDNIVGEWVEVTSATDRVSKPYAQRISIARYTGSGSNADRRLVVTYHGKRAITRDYQPTAEFMFDEVSGNSLLGTYVNNTVMLEAYGTSMIQLVDDDTLLIRQGDSPEHAGQAPYKTWYRRP